MKSAPIALFALLLAATPALAAPKPAEPAAADWRTPDPATIMVVDTNRGRIIVELAPWAAPGHVERVRLLARQGFYDGLTFFRVIDDFMAQTGDPRNDGTGGSETLPDIKAEFQFRRGRELRFTSLGRLAPDMHTPFITEVGFIDGFAVRGAPEMQMMMAADGKVSGWPLFCAGLLGMARATPPDSANSQFFFMRQTYPALDGNYTAFGRVLSGLEAVRAIRTGEPVPNPQDVMTRVRMLSDIPAAERPTVQVLNTASPSFKAIVEAARAGGAGPANACDIAVPVMIG
ncbi:MAG: peptidylprolyl isomerase [Caulobacter sp.]|nr:peptidylprolyl isomerase [Caulobacter sp.]